MPPSPLPLGTEPMKNWVDGVKNEEKKYSIKTRPQVYTTRITKADSLLFIVAEKRKMGNENGTKKKITGVL
jgi:hypothetical protein